MATAPTSFIEGALENPGLSPSLVLRMLLNRRTTELQLGRIAADSRFGHLREVQQRLFRHPNTPAMLARRLAPHLRSNELADAAAQESIAPAARRLANGILLQRLEEMTVGARVSLARRADRALIPAIVNLCEERVLRSLLNNRRLVEADVIRLAEGSRTPVEILGFVEEHPEWGLRRAIRYAVAANPHSPIPAALRALKGLEASDLQRLANDDNVASIVRVGASRVLPEPVESSEATTCNNDDPSVASP